jgi:putative transposase
MSKKGACPWTGGDLRRADVCETINGMSKYWSGAHTKHRLMVHLVWIPKYRKRVLQGRLAERIKEMLQECAETHGWHIEELNVQPDHVHIIVRFVPSISISDMVQLFKGGSSKLIRKEFKRELAEFYWRADSFWAAGYFAETFGSHNEENIREYVRNQ